MSIFLLLFCVSFCHSCKFLHLFLVWDLFVVVLLLLFYHFVAFCSCFESFEWLSNRNVCSHLTVLWSRGHMTPWTPGPMPSNPSIGTGTKNLYDFIWVGALVGHLCPQRWLMALFDSADPVSCTELFDLFCSWLIIHSCFRSWWRWKIRPIVNGRWVWDLLFCVSAGCSLIRCSSSSSFSCPTVTLKIPIYNQSLMQVQNN